ncbi:MAG: hypothetical protein JWP81_4701 [Ferruginibacter sp.]|nr:hypothetical protein [Ferruginibacter sp.]
MVDGYKPFAYPAHSLFFHIKLPERRFYVIIFTTPHHQRGCLFQLFTPLHHCQKVFAVRIISSSKPPALSNAKAIISFAANLTQ